MATELATSFAIITHLAPFPVSSTTPAFDFTSSKERIKSNRNLGDASCTRTSDPYANSVYPEYAYQSGFSDDDDEAFSKYVTRHRCPREIRSLIPACAHLGTGDMQSRCRWMGWIDFMEILGDAISVFC